MESHEARTHSRSVPNRREFLRNVGAGALAAGLPLAAEARASAQAGQPAAAPTPLPQVTIAGHRIPRMIVGCNQMGGWGHSVPYMSRVFTDYYTLERTVEFLTRCEGMGLDVWISYWDDKPRQALKTLWARGSKIRTYFLGNLDDSGKVSRDILEYKPLFYLHHGNVTDNLFRAGKQEQVHDFLKRVHDDLGIPAGISAHNPDCIKYAEDHGWEADVYQCCLYYVTRPKEEIRAKLGSAPLGESFLDGDRDDMMKVIRQVKKPCLAFKILGAGRLCESDYSIEEAFQYALGGIKPTDAILVGMWPRFKDELTQNVDLLRRYGKV